MPFSFGNPPVNYTDHAENVAECFSMEDDQSEYQRIYDVAWDDRQQGSRNLLGYAENAGTFVSRTIPHVIDDWAVRGAFKPYLYCTKIRGQGLAPRTTTVVAGRKQPVFETARLTATYRTLPYDVLSDAEMQARRYTDDGTPTGTPDESTWKRYCIVVPKPAGEFFSIPTGQMKWVSGVANDPVRFGVGKLLVYANLVVTRIGVPDTAIPTWHVNPNLTTRSDIDNALGKVNSVKIHNYDPGTILLTAVEIKPRRNPFGMRVYDYTTYFRWFQPVAGDTSKNIQFLYRPLAADGTTVLGFYQEVTTDGTTNLVAMTAGKSIYDWYDMRKVFRNP